MLFSLQSLLMVALLMVRPVGEGKTRPRLPDSESAVASDDDLQLAPSGQDRPRSGAGSDFGGEDRLQAARRRIAELETEPAVTKRATEYENTHYQNTTRKLLIQVS